MILAIPVYGVTIHNPRLRVKHFVAPFHLESLKDAIETRNIVLEQSSHIHHATGSVPVAQRQTAMMVLSVDVSLRSHC
jgi:hypothetical protein